MQTLKVPTLVTVNVLYYRPRYVHLVQTFTWQTDDLVPEYPRVKKFLTYWKKEIGAVIKEVSITDSQSGILHVDLEKFW